jgi:cytochrome b subunit of formate dehydrogenase
MSALSRAITGALPSLPTGWSRPQRAVWWMVCAVGFALAITGTVLYSLGVKSQLYSAAGLVVVVGLVTMRQEDLRTRRRMAPLVGVLAIGLVVGLLLAGRP